MNRKLWDLYAPIYKRAMKADQHIYEFMYKRIPDVIRGSEVLELATGPGLLAKHKLRQTIPPTNSIGFIDCLSLLARC